jgi:uncharacterized membrane protein
MKFKNKVLIVNLIILLVYNLLVLSSSLKDNSQLEVLLTNCVLVIAHILILSFIGLIASGETRYSFFLSSFLIAIIGFGTCLLSAQIKSSMDEKKNASNSYSQPQTEYYGIDSINMVHPDSNYTPKDSSW